MLDESNIENMTPDEAWNILLKIQAQNAAEIMKANKINQPNNENDPDFGLVPEKPVFTLAQKLVTGEEEYLNRLYTPDNGEIEYERRGSVRAEGINGMVDVYDTFLPSGQLYKTIYVNMYGATASTKAPTGFILSDKVPQPKPTFKNQYSPVLTGSNHNHSETDTLISLIPNYLRNIIIATNIILGVTSFLVLCCMWLKGTFFETETIYTVSALLCLTAGLLPLLGLKFKRITCELFIASAAILVGAVIPLFSTPQRDAARNGSVLFCLGTSITVMIITAAFLLVCTTVIFIDQYHHCASYKMKCYKNLDKMSNLLEKGIITAEDYSRIKEQITKNIIN